MASLSGACGLILAISHKLLNKVVRIQLNQSSVGRIEITDSLLFMPLYRRVVRPGVCPLQ